ncbi:MAG: YihY/virulence factor BrkB family protein [Dehalococcoidia bacterium]
MLAFAKTLWHEVSKDRVSDLAAGLAYRFMLALFPFFLFLGALSGFVAQLLGVQDPAQQVVDNLAAAAPADAQSVLSDQLTAVLDQSRPGLLSFGLIGALWSSASGLAAAMRAMNVAYDVDEGRPFWRRTLVSIGLTILSGLFLITAFLSLVVAQFAESTAQEWLGSGQAVLIALTIARYALALLLITGVAAFLYWALPNAHLRFTWISPGAALFVVSWLVATFGFSWYVSNFGSYNATYGAIGGIIVLMIWLYVTALMMLVGAEVNALLAQRHAEQPSEAEGADRQDERRRQRTADAAARRNDARDAEPTEVRARRVRPRSRLGGALAAATGAAIGVTSVMHAVTASGDDHRQQSGAQTRTRRQGLHSEGVPRG